MVHLPKYNREENMQDPATQLNKDEIGGQTEAIGPVANCLLKAVSIKLIPLCRGDSDGGRLYYKSLSASSVVGLLLRLLVPALLFVPPFVYIRRC